MPLDGTESLGLPVNRPMLEKAIEVPHKLLLYQRARKENNDLPQYCSFKKTESLHLAVNPKLFTRFSYNFSAIQGTFHLQNCCFSAYIPETISETVSGGCISDQGGGITGEKKHHACYSHQQAKVKELQPPMKKHQMFTDLKENYCTLLWQFFS